MKQQSLNRVAEALRQQESRWNRVPLSADKIKKMQMLLCADLANIGSPVACASLGMLRGGGIAHATFATASRTQPQVEAIYRRGWKLASEQRLRKNFLSVGMLCCKHETMATSLGIGRTQMQKGDYSLQCEIVLWPPGSWRRTTFAPHVRHHGIQRNHPEHKQKIVVELRMSAYHDGKLCPSPLRPKLPTEAAQSARWTVLEARGRRDPDCRRPRELHREELHQPDSRRPGTEGHADRCEAAVPRWQRFESGFPDATCRALPTFARRRRIQRTSDADRASRQADARVEGHPRRPGAAVSSK